MSIYSLSNFKDSIPKSGISAKKSERDQRGLKNASSIVIHSINRCSKVLTKLPTNSMYN